MAHEYPTRMGRGAAEVIKLFPVGKRLILMAHEFYVAENHRLVAGSSFGLCIPCLVLRYMDGQGVFHTMELTGQEIEHLLAKNQGDEA